MSVSYTNHGSRITSGCCVLLISPLLYVMSQWYRIHLGWTDTGMIPPTSSWLRGSYEIYEYDWNTNSHICGRVHTLLYAPPSSASDETNRTRNRIVRSRYTRINWLYSTRFRCFDLAQWVNNSMKTISDNRLSQQQVTIPQGREPFHPRKQPAGFSYERNMENKDRGLTSTSGCSPVDAAPC